MNLNIDPNQATSTTFNATTFNATTINPITNNSTTNYSTKPVLVTSALHRSLPDDMVGRLANYRRKLDRKNRPADLSDEQWEHWKQKKLFALLEERLDAKSDVEILADERAASALLESVYHFADERYTLFGYVVMPSHLHWALQLNEDWAREAHLQLSLEKREKIKPLDMIINSLRSFTTNAINRLFGQKGKFWHEDYFGLEIEDRAELQRVVEYMEQQPVQRKLVSKPELFKFSSARIRRAVNLNPGSPIIKTYLHAADNYVFEGSETTAEVAGS